MRKKFLLSLMLMILLALLLSVAFASPPPVTNLKATGEMGQVRISWTGSSQANGYILYRKVGNSGAFSYLYITANSGYLDKAASTSEWNFYRVYPYKTVNGKRVVGVSNKYVFSKANKVTLSAVSNLKAASGELKVTLSWNPVTHSHGYIIYRKIGSNKSQHIKTTTSTSYVDTDASFDSWNFYWVYPYRNEGGKFVLGPAGKYIYAKSSKPKYNAVVTGLKATPQLGSINISWNKISSADGYSVFRLDKKTNSFKHLKNVVGTSYNDLDMNPSIHDYEFYRVYPYKRINGMVVFGTSNRYVYAKCERYINVVSQLRGFRHPNHSDGTVYFQWVKEGDATGFVIREVDLYTREGRIVATTAATNYKLTGLDPTAHLFFEIHPYIYSNGRQILGDPTEITVRAYRTPGQYYGGYYLVGTDIPVGTYKIIADNVEMGTYYIYRNGFFIDFKEIRKGDPPVIESRFQKGDFVYFKHVMATQQP